MEVLFLGTGTSYGVPMIGCECAVCASRNPKNKRTRASIGVRHAGLTILVDTTPDLRSQALAHGLTRVDAVFLTHAHADHIFGLDDLRRFTDLQDTYLPCYGDEGTLARVQRAFDYGFAQGIPCKGLPKLRAVTLAPGGFDQDVDRFLAELPQPFRVGELQIEPLPVAHGRWATLAFRFTDPAGRSFAYATDCSAVPPLARKHLRDLDLLILDALRPTPHPTHLSLPQALEVVAELQPRRALFTHISHALDHEATNATLPEYVALAYDGQVVTVTG